MSEEEKEKKRRKDETHAQSGTRERSSARAVCKFYQ